MNSSPFILKIAFRICFVIAIQAHAQPQPVAGFTFNDGNPNDIVSGRGAKLVNVLASKDRFGNDNCAVLVQGSHHSYINLGTYAKLKPAQGSISLWTKMEGPVWGGIGSYVSPLILTKNAEGNDFYEAYAIYYILNSHRLACLNSQDSTMQTQIHSTVYFTENIWHHLVLSYTDTSLSMYLDGNLQSRINKNFKTHFLASDSVMLGHTANKKNQRYYLGEIDDVFFYDHPLTPEEVRQLYHAPNPNRNAILLKWIIIMVIGCILLLLIFLYTRFLIRKAVAREKERSRQENKALENELRVHRAMMNPHFIFNTLNGLQDFILKNANEEANDYLVRFSQLLRRIMETNMSDTISLDLELELIRGYVEMESARFDENFVYSTETDPLLHGTSLKIPIMMLQPFVENAIWHGLRDKEGDKRINVKIERYRDKYLRCAIEDNGLGRNHEHRQTGKTSMATSFVRQRLDLINKLHGFDCMLWITDKPNAGGTIVNILLPVLS